MNPGNFQIIHFDNERHRDAVIKLWKTVFRYEAAHNAPALAIDKKMQVNDGLFFVAANGDTIAGTVMAGYDGHRGWIYSLAVHPRFRKKGIGSLLLRVAEDRLTESGCMKINLQIVEGNEQVVDFYRVRGYAVEKRISMGKKLPGNIGSNHHGAARGKNHID
ncbi:GNAT family acetyltransferase [bacterium]|nr:GNAT family acetyltransferase [bacterium]